MTLTMKNYKGYDKLPYCTTHYPTTKFTSVADTPENRRIQENTKIQSNITYHADFEKQKGKKIEIADDPEMQRVRQNMNVISNVSYHGEMQRRQEMERARPAEQVEDVSDASQIRSSNPNPGRIGDYEPPQPEVYGGGGGTPYSNRNSGAARQVYDSNVGRDRVQRFSSSGDDEQHGSSRQSGQDQRRSAGYGGMEQPPTRKVGSISDYDPLNDKYGSVTGQYNDQHRGQAPPQAQAPVQAQAPYQPPPPQPSKQSRGMVCRALYDYAAADSDEVSFGEGDLIIDCVAIDAGWMEGTVEKTKKRGMLPSNYVENA